MDDFRRAGLLGTNIEKLVKYKSKQLKSIRRDFRKYAGVELSTSNGTLSAGIPSNGSLSAGIPFPSNSSLSNGSLSTGSTGSVPLVEYSCGFELREEIRGSSLVQPTATPNYEEINEPTLTQINDASCVIRDKHGYAIPVIPPLPYRPLPYRPETY